MQPLWKRRRLTAALLCVGAGVPGGVFFNRTLAADAPAANAERIEVLAKKFDFGPKEIRVRKGARVTIVLTSPDFVHGLSVPDFNVRADGIPGKTIEVTFVADKAGKFIFLCDNFCGEDHGTMTGWLIVGEG
jgi:cytochrome c oxidase subunit II